MSRNVCVLHERSLSISANSANLTGTFIAPWARGHGLSRQLIERVEEHARSLGIQVLNLDVRETQKAAIQVFETLGYRHWGTHPAYARVGGTLVRGYFYWKPLAPGLEA